MPENSKMFEDMIISKKTSKEIYYLKKNAKDTPKSKM